jgi:hypothetical protein
MRRKHKAELLRSERCDAEGGVYETWRYRHKTWRVFVADRQTGRPETSRVHPGDGYYAPHCGRKAFYAAHSSKADPRLHPDFAQLVRDERLTRGYRRDIHPGPQ